MSHVARARACPNVLAICCWAVAIGTAPRERLEAFERRSVSFFAPVQAAMALRILNMNAAAPGWLGNKDETLPDGSVILKAYLNNPMRESRALQFVGTRRVLQHLFNNASWCY